MCMQVLLVVAPVLRFSPSKCKQVLCLSLFFRLNTQQNNNVFRAVFVYINKLLHLLNLYSWDSRAAPFFGGGPCCPKILCFFLRSLYSFPIYCRSSRIPKVHFRARRRDANRICIFQRPLFLSASLCCSVFLCSSCGISLSPFCLSFSPRSRSR